MAGGVWSRRAWRSRLRGRTAAPSSSPPGACASGRPRVSRRRSPARTLFYALAEEGDARWLAEGLRLAGAAAAAELDINWNWTRFFTFEPSAGAASRVPSPLVQGMEHGAREYVERPSPRDFFYFAERQP